MRHHWIIGLALTAGFAAGPLYAQAGGYGSDTRALASFTYQNQYQYAGGFLDNSEYYITTPNDRPISDLSGSFTGTLGTRQVVSPYTAHADLASGRLTTSSGAQSFVNGGNDDIFSSISQSYAGTVASMMDTLTFSFEPSVTTSSIIGFRVKIDGRLNVRYFDNSALVRTLLTASYEQDVPPFGEYYTQEIYDYWRSDRYGQLLYYGNDTYGFDLAVSTATPVSLVVRNGLLASSRGTMQDFSSTLSLVLPEGVTYTSASGFFLSQAAAAVPEPAAWAMMIVGFGAVGATLRARRRDVSFA